MWSSYILLSNDVVIRGNAGFLYHEGLTNASNNHTHVAAISVLLAYSILHPIQTAQQGSRLIYLPS